MLVGIRTEEARVLRWDHGVTWVDDARGWQPVTTARFDAARAGDDRYAVYVWRSERHGGDTKTQKARRTPGPPARCVEALRQHHGLPARRPLGAGEPSQDQGPGSTARVGPPPPATKVYPRVPQI